MKVSEDVARQEHLDLAIVLNEGNLDRGLEKKWRTDQLLLPLFFKTTEASNLSWGTNIDF